MTEYQMWKSITDLISFLIGIQLFVGFAFIIQFIANIVIISQLPKIKKYEKLLYLKAYGFEEDDEDKETNYNFSENKKQKTEENIDQEEEFNNLVESLDKEKIELIIMGILIGLIIIIIMLKIIL